MRKKERERDIVFAKKVFASAKYASLATVDQDGNPYCIPVSPVFYKGCFYFHSALEGEKIRNIQTNPKVCMSCVGSMKVVEEKFTVAYEAAMVKGSCEKVEEKEEKWQALLAICERYAASSRDQFEKMIKAFYDRTAVYKIIPEEITGKQNEG